LLTLNFAVEFCDNGNMLALVASAFGQSRRWILLGLALTSAGVLGGWALYGALGPRRVEQQALSLAREAVSRNDLARARAIVDVALAEAPKSGAALALKADIARLRGDYNTARTSYLMAAAQDASLRVHARTRLFDLTLGIGAREEAAHHLRQLEALVASDDVRVQSRRALLVMGRP
jgi:hypothetical protein